MRRRLPGVIVLCLGAVTPAPAQEQTASIAGVVRDASGAVVPGVGLLAADADGFTAKAVTDGSGRYRFPSLPPGRFSVSAELPGFAPVQVENIDLRLGQRLDIPIALERATLSETIQIVAESPSIAITQSARATSLRGDELRVLPNGREYTDVVAQVAGANPEETRSFGLISIDGSSGAENRFIIDGVEVTDLFFGTSRRPDDRSVVTDFMEEVQVKSSGYAAEYGGSTGGVVNALTRSGTNVWHGEAILYWQDDGLDADPRPTLQLNPVDNRVAEYVTYPKDDYHALEPGFTLGGPLVRDQLWLFAGYLPYFEPVDRTAPFVDGTTATLHQNRKSHRAMVNVSGQLGSNWRFRTAFNAGRTRREGLLQHQDGTSAPDAAYDQTLVQPGWSLSGSVDWIARPDYYMSLRAGYWFRDWYLENTYQGDQLTWQTSSVGLPGVPLENQQPRGYANVLSNWGHDREKQGRLGIQWDNTIFFEGAGRHQLKAGLQLERRTVDTLGGQTGNVHDLYWDRSFAGDRGEYGYYRVQSNPLFPYRGQLVVGDVGSSNLGLFVQDSWTIADRLTLNLGLRTENEHVPSFSQDPGIPETAIHFGFGDKLAPRLGFAWDATGDGRTKLYGSWGVFYDIMKLNMPLGFVGNFLTLYWYTLDDADLSGIENNPACPPDCPGRLLFGPYDYLEGTPINDPENPAVDPDLEPMKLQELVLGLEREIAPDLTVGVRYIHKQLDRTVEDLGLRDGDGETVFRIANPGFGVASSFVPEGGTSAIAYPRARRDYDAVEIGLDKRMSGHWGGSLVYRWSRLYGNDSGLAQTDYFTVLPNFGRTFDSPLMHFDEKAKPVYGPLATDRTHQFKAQLIYDFPFGTTVGASWFAGSGIPRTRYVPFVPGEVFQVFYRGRETDGRMPFASRLDLQVQHRIRLSDRTALTLVATVFNLFDQDTAVDYFPRELFEAEAIDISEAAFFAGFDTQQLIEEQNLEREPRFLLDRYFQPSRAIRLAVRFSF